MLKACLRRSDLCCLTRLEGSTHALHRTPSRELSIEHDRTLRGNYSTTTLLHWVLSLTAETPLEIDQHFITFRSLSHDVWSFDHQWPVVCHVVASCPSLLPTWGVPDTSFRCRRLAAIDAVFHVLTVLFTKGEHGWSQSLYQVSASKHRMN